MNRWPLLAAALLATGCIFSPPPTVGAKGCAGCPPADEPTRPPVTIDVAPAATLTPPPTTRTPPRDGAPVEVARTIATTAPAALPAVTPTPLPTLDMRLIDCSAWARCAYTRAGGDPNSGFAAQGLYQTSEICEAYNRDPRLDREQLKVGTFSCPTITYRESQATTAAGRQVESACASLAADYSADIARMASAAIDAERQAQSSAFGPGGTTGSGADLAAIKAENSRKLGERQDRYNRDRAELGCDLLPTPTPNPAAPTPAPTVFVPVATPTPTPSG